MTRRNMLISATGLSLDFALPRYTSAVPSSAVPQQNQSADSNQLPVGTYAFQIGEFKAMIISDGSQHFPVHPLWSVNETKENFVKLMKEQFMPADHVDVHINVLYVDTGKHRILIDSGAGTSFGPRFGKARGRLIEAGIDPASITHIIVSHGHNDHFAGLVDDRLESIYQNALVIWAKDEWQYWTSKRSAEDVNKLPLPDSVKQGINSSARIVLPAVRRQVRLMDAKSEVVPGVQLLPATGHTPGQVAVSIRSEQDELIYLADVMHHPISSPLRPDYQPAFDHLPALGVTTRRHLFEQASVARSLIMAYHLPYPAIGHLIRAEENFRFLPISWSWDGWNNKDQ